jgi:hypothetical protein
MRDGLQSVDFDRRKWETQAIYGECLYDAYLGEGNYDAGLEILISPVAMTSSAWHYQPLRCATPHAFTLSYQRLFFIDRGVWLWIGNFLEGLHLLRLDSSRR